MATTGKVARWGGARVARRIGRTLPWIGAVIAVATVASSMRRKGVISGVLHAGLDAIPFLGTAKNVAELARGRDFFPDRYGPGVPAGRDRSQTARPTVTSENVTAR